MQSTREEQKEALETLVEFNERLLKNMKIIVKELSGKRLDDTDKFLKSIIDAINWEIQVVNGTLDVLNEEKERLNKEDFNVAVISLSNAINDNNDTEMAEEFRKITPVFEQLGVSIKEVIA